MEELIRKFVGKQIDVAFGTSSIVRGKVSEVSDGILYMEDEDKRPVFISIGKIAVIWEVKEPLSRPGFVI